MARRGRRRGDPSARLLVVARLQRAVRDRALRVVGGRGGRRRPLPSPRRRRTGPPGRAASDHDRRRISHRRHADGAVGRHGRRLPDRTGRVPAAVAGFPQATQSGVEPRRPGALQSGREPARRRGAVRLPRHLYAAPLGPGQGAASAAGAGAARIRRGRQQGAAAVAADARSDRLRPLPVAEGHGGRGRNLSSPALDGGGGDAVSQRRSRAGAVRGGGAHPRDLADEPPSPAAGQGDRGRRRSPPSSAPTPCSTSA